MDYKKTLNLPKTAFDMKANLARREPELVRRWDQDRVYAKMLAAHQNQPKFVLHDGPPYANGSIHLGTAMNKVLKDFIVKSRAMSGRFTPYLPGWDCHGLPIEHQVDKELGEKKGAISVIEKRRRCREYAGKFVDVQRGEFKRLLVLGEWEHPYLTMNYRYEAQIAREFAKFVKAGSIYRGLKPVHWCPTCKTALAEAEVEYADHPSPSIYVRFPWQSGKGPESPAKKTLLDLQKEHGPVFVMIWTTTPWTIPANLAVALHPEFSYVALKAGGAVYLLAEGLVNVVAELLGWKDRQVLKKFQGRELEGLVFRHPLYDRDSVIILADYVTLDTGTGCVHTAPGHGQEDYESGQQYRLPIYSPVDDHGRFTGEVEFFAGEFVFDANAHVNQKLKEAGNLLHAEEFTHSYPHCWRSKDPVIFRSTPQWFVSMDKTRLRGKALEQIKKTTWDPAWGEERISSMIAERSDWCLSRQRAWGVPIVAFHCQNCGEVLLDGELVDRVADLFAEHGCDVWFAREAKDLLPTGTRCRKCGGSAFDKDSNILDVWFDSGVSFACVLEEREDLGLPCDLYIEGTDQHRGWFHSSLLCAVGTRGFAPYRTVLTHGFTVDEDGKKYSKSSGNYVPLEKLLQDYGAELLRMWAASENFRNDIRFSRTILDGIATTYRKVRNTLRYMLGNLFDFDPGRDALPVSELFALDRWMLHRVEKFKRRALAAYDRYEFHLIYHGLNTLCAVDLSALYFDIVRDRLYCEKADGKARRSAQTAIWTALDALVRLMAPILSFTAEEVYAQMPVQGGRRDTVFELSYAPADDALLNEELGERLARLFLIREEVNKALDQAQKEKLIGHPNDAQVVIAAGRDEMEFLRSFRADPEGAEDLRKLLLVSAVELKEKTGGDLEVKLSKAPGRKCERCWTYATEVGSLSKHPTLCPRCYNVLEAVS
ncbi:MAG: isoleucine--tRNA ligase [Deltaproteobacteria bacterium RBG_13_61_14]|nr:MAG: isoleucine--tRNA ligase [Deltaproteobacteria bacterium RBG_13_61_14]